jgi:hypothetical protein
MLIQAANALYQCIMGALLVVCFAIVLAVDGFTAGLCWIRDRGWRK